MAVLVKFGLKVFMDAHNTVTVEEGDRYHLRPPKPTLGPCRSGKSVRNPVGGNEIATPYIVSGIINSSEFIGYSV